jgi:hypothetical protein
MKPADLLIVAGLVLLPTLGMAREEPPPEMEMLEFLGSFETARGKPVDPLAFAEANANARDNRKEQPAPAKKDVKRGRKTDRPEQKEHDNEK